MFNYSVACLIIFSSCISVKRNIKPNSNGSGIETTEITFSREFFMMMSSMFSSLDSSKKNQAMDSLYDDFNFIKETTDKYKNIPGVRVLDIHSTTNFDSSKTIFIKIRI